MDKKVRIALLSRFDYANVLSNWSYAINKHLPDAEARSISFKPHIFNYPIKHDYDLAKITDKFILGKAKDFLINADYVLFSEEIYPTAKKSGVLNSIFKILSIKNPNEIKAFRNNKIIVFHSGSTYRDSYEKLNDLCSRYWMRLYSPDLYRLSPMGKNDRVIFPSLHLDEADIFSEAEVIKTLSARKFGILHTPSNKKHKNSNIISKCINDLAPKLQDKGIIYKEVSGISNQEILDIKKDNLFFIDQFNYWGGLGVSGIESMSTGGIVLCSMQNTHQNVFIKFSSNKKPIPVAYVLYPDQNDLKEKIERYIGLGDEKLLEISLKSRAYYLDNFSPKATSYAFVRNIFQEKE